MDEELLDLGENEREAAEPAPETEQTPKAHAERDSPGVPAPDVNAVAAAARRQAEAEARAYRERMEALARSRGFASFDELEAAVQSERQAREREQYRERYGIDPEALGPLVQRAVEESPAVRRARELCARDEAREVAGFREAQLRELCERFPQAGVTSYEELKQLPNAREILGLWAKGVPLAKAYAAANLGEITGKTAAAARQAAINAIHGKSHLAATAGGAAGPAEVPPDKYAEFKRWNPGATDAEIQKFYARVGG